MFSRKIENINYFLADNEILVREKKKFSRISEFFFFLFEIRVFAREEDLIVYVIDPGLKKLRKRKERKIAIFGCTYGVRGGKSKDDVRRIWSLPEKTPWGQYSAVES